jgi:hypothetical protein
MRGWFQRRSQRRHDLTRGVDADLVRDNRKRFKIAFGLIGLGILLALLGGELHTANLLHWVLLDTGGVSVLAGFLLAIWAREESAFLTKPDPEEPPTIFKQ